MERILSQKDKLLEDSSAWVLSHTVFSRWLNEDTNSVLWLHGDPGKGKTMMSISLIQELASIVHLAGHTGVGQAYFFCDNKDSRRNTATSILRGLVYQLICQFPKVCVFLREQWEKQKDQLFASSNSVHSLWRILRMIAGHEALEKVYIVIDALDECDIESMEEFLSLLEGYIDNNSEPSAPERDPLRRGQDSPGKVKWLLTSRNEVAIQEALSGALDISLEENHLQVSNSVNKFIEAKLAKLQRVKKYDTKLRDFVSQTLREKAEQTFLWVSLACRELSKPTVKVMNTKSVLVKLPSGLVPMYQRILEQLLLVEEESLVFCVNILRAMVVALRPLTLPELAIAAGLPEEHRHDMPVLAEYVNMCGSLVTVRSHTAYFVHQSAKTFLLNLEAGKIMSPQIETDHQFVALNCFAYISTSLPLDHHKGDQFVGEDLQELEPEYPVLFFTEHTRRSPDNIADEFDLNCEFFNISSPQRDAWLDLTWKRCHAQWETKPSNFTVFHAVAYAGLTGLLGRLLGSQENARAFTLDSLGNSTLLWAAKGGHEKCVQLLIKFGIDVGTRSLDGMTALQWAAALGHENIVRHLFESGASITVKDKNGWAPLHRAAYNGHTTVAKLLLDLGADPEEVDGSTWTALHRAASMGQIDVVRLLLERGASSKALDREDMTPILHAAWAGQTDAVRLLLEHGNDINDPDGCGWTALHNASWNGHIGTVHLLIKNNANVNAANGEGATPLHHATWSGHHEVVQLLLKVGANANAKDNEGETPLQQAAWRGHLKAVEALLGAGVEVNAINNVGHTALHQAASTGEDDVVRALLHAGANSMILDKHLQSPRALAEANEHESTAAILEAKERELKGPEDGSTPSPDLPQVDEAVATALGIDPKCTTVEPHQTAGFFVPEKITARNGDEVRLYYMKSGKTREMFESTQYPYFSQPTPLTASNR